MQINWLDEFMEGHKGFICGGCFKNIFTGKRVKDLDVFFQRIEDWYVAVEYFNDQCAKNKYVPHYENKNVKAYKHIKTGTVIELCRKIFGTAQEIVNQFDFTIVKFAYYKAETFDPFVSEKSEQETHMEYKVLCDDKFFEHLHMNKLVTDDKILYPASTFERSFRYAKYGFFPCKETKLKMIKALQGLNTDEIVLSESLYDGLD